MTRAPSRVCRGFTVLELMVSLLLAALLALAYLQVYLGARTALRWQQASASVDLRGFRALDLLTRDVRMAGFFGGADPERIARPVAAPDCAPGDGWALRPVPLVVTQPESPRARETLPCLPLDALVPASAIVALRRVDGAATWGWASRWQAGRARDTQWYLRVSPEGSAEFLWFGEGVVREPPDAGKAVYWGAQAKIYYLRNFASTRGDRLPTLCVERLMSGGMRSECLVEGVEALHLEFSIDSDGDGAPDRMVGDLGDVTGHVNAHLFLVARSLVAPGTERDRDEYRLGSRRLSISDDGHLRRVFRATVPLRNYPPPA